MAQVAVCSQINTKHINTVWAERVNFIVEPGGAYKGKGHPATGRGGPRGSG